MSFFFHGRLPKWPRDSVTPEKVVFSHFQENYYLTITALFYGSAVLYTDYSNHTDRLKQRWGFSVHFPFCSSVNQIKLNDFMFS